MQNKGRFLKILTLITLVLIASLGIAALAIGQVGDVEPNNACITAQEIGAVSLPFSLTGSLDTPPETPDVDFYRFSGTAGDPVRADLEGAPTSAGTLPDPLLGLFDSGCNLIALNDDMGSLNSRLQFTVPDDGIFVLAATAFADFDFTGSGGSSGTYRLSLSPLVTIESISGRLVDAGNGDPLPGDSYPYSYVELWRCFNGECFEFVNAQSADANGRFFFDTDYTGGVLTVDSYQIGFYADQYHAGRSDIFTVSEGEDADVGDILVQPFPIQFSDARACESVPESGGRCRYSVRVTNRSGAPMTGAAWSTVYAGGIGSGLGFSNFQPNPPRPTTLAPEQTKVVRFEFTVPGTVNDGAFMCAEAWFGADRRNPYFSTAGQRFLFCVTKEPAGEFSEMPLEEGRALLEQARHGPDRPAERQGLSVNK